LHVSGPLEEKYKVLVEKQSFIHKELNFFTYHITFSFLIREVRMHIAFEFDVDSASMNRLISK
jgi:hypothetical protein